ncbi:MAG: TonB-dependent receptor [Rikenellaceae bacterium]
MRKFLFIVLVALLASVQSAVWAQKVDTHVIGDVVDKDTGEHIPYATVTIAGTTIGAITDATGHFMLSGISEGEHTITASFAGYASDEITVKISENITTDIQFRLEQKSLEVDEVVVTGTRSEVSRKKSSVVVNVANTKLFEKTASNNVGEVLNFQPGLRVETTCSNCGATQLRINGLSGQYSQILLDSRAIFSSLSTVYGLDQLPASMIERVEVIRGGGSALFGSNAIGGVVNIITKEPKYSTVVASNSTSVTDLGTTDINTSINAALVSNDTRTGIYIFSMLRNRDYYDRNGDGFSEAPSLDSETVGFRAYHRPTTRSTITAEYHYIGEERRGGSDFDLPAHEADIAEQLQHRMNGGGLKYDYYSNNYKHRFSLYSSLQSVQRDSYFGVGQDPNAYGTTSDFTYIFGGQYVYAMDRLLFSGAQLTVGAEHTANNLHDIMVGYDRDLEQNSRTSGIFFQNEWQSDKFSLLLGGRVDKHNFVDNIIFSPRANVRYTPLDLIGMRLSYSSGYRAPQAYDEDLHVEAVAGEVSLIVMDPDLRPEYSNSISGSVDLYGEVLGVETNFLAEAFYTDLDDVFALQTLGYNDDGNLLLERVNVSGAVVKGVNMELKMGFSPKLILEGGYTVQSSRYKEDFEWSDQEGLEPQRKMFRSPNQYGYATLTYNPIPRLSSSITANYTGTMLLQHYGNGETTVDTEVVTPTFWDTNIRIAYDFSLTDQIKLQLNGGVKNIFDAFQSDIDEGILRDSKYIYGPSYGRTYFIGIKFTM